MRGAKAVRFKLLIGAFLLSMGAAFLGACCLTRTAMPPKNAVECVTMCGLHAERGDCEALKDLEARALLAVDRYADDITAHDLCVAVKGWRIQIHHFTAFDEDKCVAGAWWDSLLRLCIAGEAHEIFPPHTIELAHVHWTQSALVHEMLHVVDISRGKHTGPWHCDWQELGRKDALFDATGYPDHTKPEKSCP
jgi:hypothetical protein